MKKKQKPLVTLLKKLKSPTNHCIKCFNKIEENNIVSLAKSDYFLCNSCLNEKKTHFQKFNVDGVSAYSIYDYDTYIQDNIYRFKGCYDYELHKLFLYPYERELRLFFSSYVVVPIPSYIEDDKRRGFNHVEAIFSRLNLKMIKILEKTNKIKQADLSKEERNNIHRYMKVNNVNKIKDKKVLLVDDIFTTGSTIKACLKLIREGKPKSIKILVIAKTKDIKQN